MSDKGSVEPAPLVEPKQRITRSSIGQSASGTNLNESVKQEEANLADNPPAPTLVKRKMGVGTVAPQTTRRSLRSTNKLNNDEESDNYCWICRKDGSVVPCQLCPRVYHLKCLGLTTTPKEDWICVECEKVMRSECEDTKPKSMSSLRMDELITCLQYALERMKVPNSEVFQVPVDPAMEPEYHNIIAHPMDMSTLDKNIKKKHYGSTESFLADAKWILHNSIIYNGMHNKYTMTAKAVLKMCRNQMTEIETCPDCFLASCTQEANWFCKPCRLIHPLVWAKLKGYPFWPAKALKEVDGQVDCRFFGAHDKAWVPANQVFMLSAEPPATIKNKKGSGFDDAMAELDKYITKFKARYGKFEYSSVKELYRSDFGQPSVTSTTPTSEAKKRRMSSPSTEAEPAKKLAADNNKTESQEKDVLPVTKTEVTTPVVKEVLPEVKSECVKPVKPGVFSISDEALAEAADTNFSVMSEEIISRAPTSSVVSKIEETLRQSEQSDTQQTSAEVSEKSTTDTPSSTNNIATNTQTEESTAKSKGDDSQPMETSESTATSAGPSDADKKLSNEEYIKKLESTIVTCKTKLGLAPDQEVDEAESEESESDSESEYEYVSTRRRSRSSRPEVIDSMTEKEREVTNQLLRLMREGLETTIKDVVKQALSGQAPVPVTQTEEVDNENTTTDINEADKPADDSETLNKTVEPINLQINGRAPESEPQNDSITQNGTSPMKLDTSPSKLDPSGTKSEPLGDTNNQENSPDTNTDLPISSELVEKLTWKHKCEIESVKHTAELAAMEMRKSIELEKERALWRLRKQLEHKFKKIIEETKKKQWCAMCGKEAIFYCCWNTSYCDYPCQQKHWPSHLKTCAQISKDEAGGEKKTSQQSTQQQSNNSSSSTERAPQTAHSNSTAPPPYMPSSSTSSELPTQQYQLMQGQVQYMPVPTNAGHVYQAQMPIQAMPMQAGPRGQVSPAGAPMLYPVMPPPSQQGPPQPQSYMLSQRQPYRLAPKYS